MRSLILGIIWRWISPSLGWCQLVSFLWIAQNIDLEGARDPYRQVTWHMGLAYLGLDCPLMDSLSVGSVSALGTSPKWPWTKAVLKAFWPTHPTLYRGCTGEPSIKQIETIDRLGAYNCDINNSCWRDTLEVYGVVHGYNHEISI